MDNTLNQNQSGMKKALIIYALVVLAGLCIIPFTRQLDFIAGWQNPSAIWIVKIFQFFSDSVSFISFGIPVAITIAREVKSGYNKKQNRLSLLYIVLSIAIGGLVSRIIKESVAEPRPYEVDPRIVQLSVGGGYSFPSGHTTEAFASAMAVSLLFARWTIIIPLFAWASLVALSRIYLGVHYPFDIFMGMFIGSLSAWALSYFLFRKYLNRSAVK
ncbi:MAG: putative membrane-associated phospholipid phosphatase, PAP2 superfamily [Cytophagales bacterium]|jgi:undecaprenyl-diphosphatase|nr:phosphatase PAP2 family protein [Bacteroidota bacterium]WHZ09423.1 MAG: putative membrane-associated phospholipid phosphatase, PAP2 superfamily [Cytophagales bacterium]